MKKYTALVALTAVLMLAMTIVVTWNDPVSTVRTPYSIEKVENLTRIELTQPGESGGLVVFTKGEGGWKLTKPVEAPVADRLSEQFDGVFGGKINTDDIKLDATKLDEFGLGDDKATKIALYPKGAQAPAAEFFFGKTITVDGTRAKRTYIKAADGKVYRAHTDVGQILNKPVDQLRSNVIQRLDRKAVSKIDVTYQDPAKNLTLAKDGDNWKLSAPVVDFELERGATSALLNGISSLTASGFADDVTASQAGLDPYFVKLTASNAEGPMGTILISKLIREPGDDANGDKVYAKTADGAHIFQIAPKTAEQLAVTPLDLRTRLVKDLKNDDVARVDFAGDERVAIERRDDGWAFVRGGSGKVKVTALTANLSALTQLRASRFETPDLAKTGLEKGAQVTLTMKDGAKHTLIIGDARDEGEVWAKWANSDLVMVLPKWIVERSAPTAASLTDDAS